MKKILLGLLLLLSIGCDAQNNSSQMANEAVLARDIVLIKERLAEYQVSESFFQSTGDVLSVALLGAAVGCVGGAAQAFISDKLLNDFSLFAGARSEQALNIFRIEHLLLQMLSSAIAGLGLGIAGQAGSLPQMSKMKILQILVLHNAIASMLGIAADTIGVDYVEAKIKEEIMTDPLIANLLTRPMLFMNERSMNSVASNYNTFVLYAAIPQLIAQVIALLAVVPEAIIVRSHRKELATKKQALEASLKDLQLILNRVNYSN